MRACVYHLWQESIRKLLEVEPEGVIRSSSIIRTNICPSVSVAGDRERALVELLRSPRFTDSKSIVVYCMLQKQVRYARPEWYPLQRCSRSRLNAPFVLLRADRSRRGIPHRRRLRRSGVPRRQTPR